MDTFPTPTVDCPVPARSQRSDSATTLDRLLTEELRYSPSYAGTYSLHLAMSLVALYQLGATSQRLQDEFDRHGDGSAEARSDVAELHERVDEVHALGIAEVIRRRAPTLVDGPATALFHPLIRLAHGIEADHGGQVAAALLDWETRFHVLHHGMLEAGSRRPTEVLRALGNSEVEWPTTWDFDAVARGAELGAALDGLGTENLTIDDVAELALIAHGSSGSFVTLHLVTAARAARSVASLLDDGSQRRLCRAMVVESAVAYAATGAPRVATVEELDQRRGAALPSREAIAAKAIASSDPHVIKLVNVALSEELRTGDLLYRDFAAHAVAE